jgi:hypothetical protein
LAQSFTIINVLLVKIEELVYLVYHLSSNKPVVKGVSSNPSFFINQPGWEKALHPLPNPLAHSLPPAAQVTGELDTLLKPLRLPSNFS